MELKKITCPNCGGTDIKQIGDGHYKCSYCDTNFVVDYDEADARVIAAEKELTMQRERFEHEDKVRREERDKRDKDSDKRDLKIHLTVVFAVVLVIAAYSVYAIVSDRIESAEIESRLEQSDQKKFYALTAKDYEDGMDLSEFRKTADSYISKDVDQIYSGTWQLKEDPKLVKIYLLTNEEECESELYFFYEHVWVNDKGEEEHRYKGIYFSDIKVNDKGQIVSSYYPYTIGNTEFLGNNLIEGYFNMEDACRENITSQPDYTATEIEIN